MKKEGGDLELVEEALAHLDTNAQTDLPLIAMKNENQAVLKRALRGAIQEKVAVFLLLERAEDLIAEVIAAMIDRARVMVTEIEVIATAQVMVIEIEAMVTEIAVMVIETAVMAIAQVLVTEIEDMATEIEANQIDSLTAGSDLV